MGRFGSGQQWRRGRRPRGWRQTRRFYGWARIEAVRQTVPTAWRIPAGVRTLTRRADMRVALVDALMHTSDARERLDREAIGQFIGNAQPAGRDLAAPLSETRHTFLRYLFQIDCGFVFLSSDPRSERRALRWSSRTVIRHIALWRRQLQVVLGKQPALLPSPDTLDGSAEELA